VLAGLEVIATLNEAEFHTWRPIAVAFFTNEEGSRFQPDMFGSLVYTGDLKLDQALATRGIDGITVGEAVALATPVPSLLVSPTPMPTSSCM
jgi:N-carbamoyl-L-amino-acid hydrolase